MRGGGGGGEKHISRSVYRLLKKSDDVKVIDNVIIEGEELEGKCSVMEFILDYKVIHSRGFGPHRK